MVAIYVRQSLDKKDSLSIESQIDDCINLCKRSGWNDYKVYQDKGWSAKNLDRPSFKQLNKDVEAGLIETVICYKIDRISRNIRDLVNLVEDYRLLGVHFISCADNINTAAPGGLMMATLMGSLAQMEREAIITRVTDSYYYRCGKGYWGGGPAPYGYALQRIVGDDGKKHTTLIANEKEAAVVRQFFKWYLEPDGTVCSILRRASERGITTRRGGVWTSRVVSDILSKPLYAPNTMDIYNFYASQGVRTDLKPEQCDGTLSVNVYGMRDRSSDHPKRSRPVEEMTLSIARHKPIIDADTFLQVQAKKGARLATPPRAGTSKTTILSGLVKCSCCGRAMSPSGSNRGVKYFSCSGRRNYASGTCSSRSVKVEQLESMVINIVLDHITDPAIVAMFHNKYSPKMSAEDAHKVNTLQQEIAQIDINIGNLLDACVDGNAVAVKYLNDRIETLDQKKQALQRKVIALRNDSNAIMDIFNNIDIDHAPDLLRSGSFSQKQFVCQQFIKKVTYTNDLIVSVEYNI